MMKDSFIQMADYIDSLEQRIAALENRLEAADAAESAQQTLIAALEARIVELEARPVNDLEENEVEVELIMGDEETEPESENEVENALEKETIEEPQTEMVEELLPGSQKLSHQEPEPAQQEVVQEIAPLLNMEEVSESEKIEEPVIAATVAAAQIAQSEEVVAAETAPEPAHGPVQTSLFGSTVDDIRHALSLGDRFLFQRELFGGKGELMQKTLDQLNTMGSLNEAVSYIDSKFSWDKQSSTYELFLNVLRRRFN